MDILTRNTISKDTNDFKEVFYRKFNELVCPTVFNPSAINYGEFISSIGYLSYSMVRDALVETFKEMDDYFFNSEGRCQRYYSKGFRKREIITVFGRVIFYRHEYIDRANGESFIYVDEKIGLGRRDRYDPCVCAKVYERYAKTNSMIKVGEDIGTDLMTPFTLDDSRFIDAIPRQTVWKILHKFKKIDPPSKELETPETLYIMADEKYIPSQGNDNKDLMCKEVIVHEGIETVETVISEETGEVLYERKKLVKPKKFLNYNEDIYKRVSDYLCTTYDIDKIKQVYLMGDGGTWIKNGLFELSGYSYKIEYGLDKFHFVLAVNTITKDDTFKSLLYYYSIKNMKDDFNYLIDLIIKSDEARKEIINEKADYIRNHLKEIRTMYKYIKICCAMEQAISHDIMSEFTSIPKAYAPKWLPYYLSERENYLNGYDLRKLYLSALDSLSNNDDEDNEVKLEPHINTSFFDNQVKEEWYKLSKGVNIQISKNWRYTH